MVWRLHEIKITNFKAFGDGQSILLKGKNLLLFGDNGSGKNSIFWSLYTLYQSCYKKSRDKVSKYFDATHEENLLNRYMSDNESSIVATFKDDSMPAHTKLLQLSKSEMDIVGSNDIFTKATTTFSDFFNYQKQSSLFDYCNSEENDVFKPFLRDMFPFIHLSDKLVKIDGTEVESDSALDAWTYLVQAVSKELVGDNGNLVAETDEKYQAFDGALRQFNEEFKKELQGIESKTNTILDEKMKLSNIKLMFEYDFASFNLPVAGRENIKDSLLHSGKILVTAKDANITDENRSTIKHPRTYFNEATLSKIALAIRLAIFEIKGSFVAGEGAKLLFVDDLLVTFDMKNRIDVIKILLSYANEYQLVIFTHDRAFYNMVKGIIADKEQQKAWVYDNIYMVRQNDLSYPTPKIIEEKSYIDMAKKYFDENDSIACAVYLRKETERIVKSLLELRYCCSESMVLGKVPTLNLSDLLDRLKKEFYDCNLPFDIGELNVLRRDVMNISVHDDAYSPIYRNELEKAIGVVEMLGTIKRKVICNASDLYKKRFTFYMKKQNKGKKGAKPAKEIKFEFMFCQSFSRLEYLGKTYYSNVKLIIDSSAVLKNVSPIEDFKKGNILRLKDLETKMPDELKPIDLGLNISYKGKKLKEYKSQ